MFEIIKNFIKEVASLYIFYSRTEKNKRDVVFYAEDKSSYKYFEGLIDRLTKYRNINICYITSDISDPILFQRNNKNIKSFYINFFLSLFVITLDSKLIIMTMPDLQLFHIRRSQRGACHVYLFHNIGSSFPVIRFGALFYYDVIFCVGDHHIEEIRKQEEIYKLPQKKLVKFGYYNIEKIHSDYENYTRHITKEPSLYKARILIGPTWGTNSILDVCGLKLIRILLRSNYEVIIRPHPMTRNKTPQLLMALNDEFKGLKNYKLEDSFSLESIYNSDLLISDWSGLIFEYVFGTERPVLFINLPQKIVNTRYKEVGITPIDYKIRNRIGVSVDVTELGRIDEVITYLVENKDKFVDTIKEVRGELVYNFGNSSHIGAEFICNFLNSKGDDS
jgi:YidC/Oxa1 family membrane protein insertase